MPTISARLRAYVEHESPSHDLARCAALARRIHADLASIGGRAQLLEAGDRLHVLAEFGSSDGSPLVVLGHLDTVHPVGTLAQYPLSIDPSADRVSGPGVYDMKAGVALMIDALEQLLREHRLGRRVRMLVTSDEEIGSKTSRELIEAEARAACAVLVPEPSLDNGGVKTSRKGVSTYQVLARGRAAHAGIEPQHGVNAITELAHQVLWLQQLARPEVGTTITVGTVRGGTATNVVPAEAIAQVDVRYKTQDEADRVHAALLAATPVAPGAQVEVTQTEARPPLERTPKIVELYERARAIARAAGLELHEGGTGGGSDGCLAAAVGAATLDGLGPRGGGAHTLEEHVRLSDLPLRLAFYRLLLERV